MTCGLVSDYYHTLTTTFLIQKARPKVSICLVVSPLMAGLKSSEVAFSKTSSTSLTCFISQHHMDFCMSLLSHSVMQCLSGTKLISPESLPGDRPRIHHNPGTIFSS